MVGVITPLISPHDVLTLTLTLTRVVAVLKEDVAAGEELCNSYIDVELPYAQRQRELAEYGFACTCVKCAAEQPSAAAPARAPRKLK